MAKRSLLTRVLRPYLRGLARLALWAKKPMIIGVTGTAGKSTTTHVIASVLAASSVGRVHFPAENMNDQDGMPLVILLRSYSISGAPALEQLWQALGLIRRTARILLSRDYPRILVLEMGTCRPGLLRKLVALARPDIGIITNIGPGHLEELGSIEGVYQEKMDVLRAVPEDGLAIVGAMPEWESRIRSEIKAPVVVAEGEGLELSIDIARIVAARLSVESEMIDRAIARLDLPRGRLNRIEAGPITVFDDTFNANPLSMAYGIRRFSQEPVSGRRILILGSMVELGVHADRYHREVGERARAAADLLIGVGEAARLYEPDHWFADAAACVAHVAELLEPGDSVFVKGSNSIGLSAVVDRLRTAFTRSDPMPA